MKIATFFQPIKDSENLDLKTEITIPDQTLTVREILQRFSRGQMEIPPIDYGQDDEIDSPTGQFDDIVDAFDSINYANNKLRQESIKNFSEETSPEEVERSETSEEELPN